MDIVLSAILVSVITSFLVTVMLLRGYSNSLTEMLETFFDKEWQAREELQKLVLDTMDRIANKYKQSKSFYQQEQKNERIRKNSPQRDIEDRDIYC